MANNLNFLPNGGNQGRERSGSVSGYSNKVKVVLGGNDQQNLAVLFPRNHEISMSACVFI